MAKDGATGANEVTVRIPKDPYQTKPEPVIGFVNGVRFEVARGEDATVPQAVAEVLKNAGLI